MKQATVFFQLGYKHGRDLKNVRDLKEHHSALKRVPAEHKESYTLGFHVARRQAYEGRKQLA
jgi:hypothetical protein